MAGERVPEPRGPRLLLQSGDVIFQSSSSNQSSAIMWASKSLYSHVGLVEVSNDKTYVIEAISRVSRTPLEKWVARGRLGRFAVYRHHGLDAEKRDAVVRRAKEYLGRPYDIFFTSTNDEIYCSELIDLAFRKTGFAVGKFQKVKELDVDNPLVRALVKKRWRRHPLCKSGAASFEQCWSLILGDELVTPESIAVDPSLQKIWSNYP